MNLLEQFVNDGCDELLVVVGGQPRAKKLGRWLIYKNQDIMLSDWGKLSQSLQKNCQYHFHFFQKSDLFKFYLIRQEISTGEIELPQRGIEFLKKSNGLTVFIGVKDAKLNLLIDHSLKMMGQDLIMNTLVLNPEGVAGIYGSSENYTIMNYIDIDILKCDKLYHGFDCVVFIEPVAGLIQIILHLLDKGIKVIISVNARNILNAIQKILSFMTNDRNSQLRLFAQTDALFYQMKSGQDCYVHELVFLNDQIRQLIHEQRWNEFEQFLSQSNDHPNLISMNQSLIQQILKRKIDLRKAFELTRYPNQLDMMLKKVGI